MQFGSSTLPCPSNYGGCLMSPPQPNLNGPRRGRMWENWTLTPANLKASESMSPRRLGSLLGWWREGGGNASLVASVGVVQAAEGCGERLSFSEGSACVPTDSQHMAIGGVVCSKWCRSDGWWLRREGGTKKESSEGRDRSLLAAKPARCSTRPPLFCPTNDSSPMR